MWTVAERTIDSQVEMRRDVEKWKEGQILSEKVLREGIGRTGGTL